MKTVTISMTWRNSVTVEVPDDFEVPDYLSDFPDDILDQMDAQGAELVDWTESG